VAGRLAQFAAVASLTCLADNTVVPIHRGAAASSVAISSRRGFLLPLVLMPAVAVDKLLGRSPRRGVQCRGVIATWPCEIAERLRLSYRSREIAVHVAWTEEQDRQPRIPSQLDVGNVCSDLAHRRRTCSQHWTVSAIKHK